jgi:hypothetical protein
MSDPDQYQIKKHDPDPQHCVLGSGVLRYKTKTDSDPQKKLEKIDSELHNQSSDSIPLSKRAGT